MPGPRIVLALLGLGLGLVLGEAATRMTGVRLCVDAPGVFLEADAALGWRQRPNLRGWAVYCHGKPIPATPIETDARGFRNPGRPLEKPPGTARILLLGGNLPQAHGVPWLLSMAGMIEGRADARVGRPLEVVNGAMASYGLDQDLTLLRREGARVAPDIVLAVIDATVESVAVSPTLIGLRGVRVAAKPYLDVVDGALVPLALPEPEPPPVLEPLPDGLLGRSQLYRLVRGLPPSRGVPQAWLPEGASVLRGDLDAERARAERVLVAILTGLRDESAALGARFVLALAPPPVKPRPGEETPNHHVFTLAQGLGIPTTNMTLAFWGFEQARGSAGYFPETTRLDADGHFLASQLIWSFLEKEGLLPAGVVPARIVGGGRVAPLEPFPDALLAALRMQQTGTIAVVGGGLVGVILLWLAAPLPARARDAVALATSLALVAFLARPVAAVAALGFALALYVVADLRQAWIRRPLLALLWVALAVGPLAWIARLPSEQSVPIRLYVALAGAMGALRAFSYAAEPRRGRTARPPLVQYLLGLFFFPTFCAGPIQSVAALAVARGDGGLAPATRGALARHLVGAARGAMRLAWGTAKLLVVTACLNVVTPDVIASGGDAVGRARLWLWTAEISLCLWALYSGWSDVSIGLGAMAGVRVPENFHRPWAAASPAALWRRALTTVTLRFERLVGVPIRRRFGASAGVVASFVAGASWYAWTVLVIYGVFGIRPGACLGVVAWALAHAAAVLGFERLRSPVRGGSGRMLGAAATQLLLALGWVPLMAFPRAPLAATLQIYARLVGLR